MSGQVLLSDAKKLWGRAAGRCSFPGCSKALTFDGKERALNLGQMAHIVGEKEGAARTSHGLGNNKYENLILLCPNHHLEIDTDELSFPIELLHEWKREHEDIVDNIFKDREISDIEMLKQEVSLLLYENHELFLSKGPKSEAAEDPSSNVHLDWEIVKVSEMIPNNNKIINLIEANMKLLNFHQRKLFILFKDHALSWERNVYNRIDSYRLFPEEFNEEFNLCKRSD